MTRAEALRRLKGTWSHQLRDGRVYVRDVAVLRAVRQLRREGDYEAERQRRSSQGQVLVG